MSQVVPTGDSKAALGFKDVGASSSRDAVQELANGVVEE